MNNNKPNKKVICFKQISLDDSSLTQSPLKAKVI